MESNNCLDAFIEGRKNSLQYPRKYGADKLKERLHQWRKAEDEVSRILGVINGKFDRLNLKHCTYKEIKYWLSNVPIFYSYEFSADIIPAFEALSGDGMSKTDVDYYLPLVNQCCENNITKLENARTTFEFNIYEEYSRMRVEKSFIRDSLVESREILENLICLTPISIQNYILIP